jgi:hypothetical protein
MWYKIILKDGTIIHYEDSITDFPDFLKEATANVGSEWKYYRDTILGYLIGFRISDIKYIVEVLEDEATDLIRIKNGESLLKNTAMPKSRFAQRLEELMKQKENEQN